MEKLGCEYCNDYKLIFDNSCWTIGMRDNKLDINCEGLGIDFNLDFCPMCGRNLKTNNPMIEVKPIEFPSWEEFEKEKDCEVVTKGYKARIMMMNGSISCGITKSKWYSDCSFENNLKPTKQGYKKACGEIERIRIGFIMELCKG